MTPTSSRLLRILAGLRSSEGTAARFARGSLSSILVNVVGVGVSFGTQVMLAQALGTVQYGSYAYLLGWMNWAALVTRFQLDGCAPRFVAQYAATGHWGLARGFVRLSHGVVAAGSVFAMLLAVAVVSWTDALSSVDRPAVVAISVLLVPSALILVSSACAQGLQRMISSQAASLVLRPGLLALIVGFLWWRMGRVSAAGAIWSNVAATLAALAVTGVLLRRALATGSGGSGTPALEARLWIRTAVGFWWVTAAQQLLSAQTDILVVGTLRTRGDAGLYGAATQLGALVQFGVQAISIMGAPLIAQLHAQGRGAELARLMKHYGRLNLLVSLPVFAGIAFFGRPLLSLYGDDFIQAYPVLILLSATQVVGAAVGTQSGYLLTMTGRERTAGLVTGACAVASLALSLFLTMRIGMVGTALATLLGGLLRGVLLERVVRREFGFSPLPV